MVKSLFATKTIKLVGILFTVNIKKCVKGTNLESAVGYTGNSSAINEATDFYTTKFSNIGFQLRE